jgi:hypothetical protein
MPRAKPSNASPVFTAYPHTLSDAAKVKLLELLGYGGLDLLEESVQHQFPDAKIVAREPGAPLVLARNSNSQSDAKPTNVGKAILDVERALGLYIDGAKHLDNIPRPIDYVRAVRPVRKKAYELFNEMVALSQYYSDQLKLKGVDVDSLELVLASLVDAAGKVVNEFESMPSQGARKNTALTEVIQRLRGIFRDNYRGPITERKTRGAFQWKATQETQELLFVKTALLDARIIKKNYKELPRLFRDARCSLLEERNTVIGRLAKKHQRKQKRNIK